MFTIKPLEYNPGRYATSLHGPLLTTLLGETMCQLNNTSSITFYI